MSRWSSAFESHQFHEVWNQLNQAISQIAIDDPTATVTAEEVSRLRKIFSYIDSILKSVDPDLMPLSLLDNSKTQANNCLQQINQYATSKNNANLVAANDAADNILTYIKPYIISDADSAKALYAAVKTYTASINSSLEAFEKNAQANLEQINVATSKVNEVQEYILSVNKQISDLQHSLFGGEGIKGKDAKFETLLNESTSKSEQIKVLYDDLLVDKDGAPALKNVVSENERTIQAAKEASEKALNEIQSKKQELEDFYAKVYGLPAPSGELQPGLKKEIDDRLTQLSNIEIDQQAKFDALNLKVEDLLPGAASAGLASEYSAKKRSYMGYITAYSVFFYLSLIALLSMAIYFAPSDPQNLDELLRAFLIKLPIYAPVIWFAYFVNKRRSENKRLLEEYSHKEAMAKSYESYKKQIADLKLDDSALIEKLMDRAIDVISYNASVTLDGKHDEKMPIHQMLSEVSKSFKSKLGE